MVFWERQYPHSNSVLGALPLDTQRIESNRSKLSEKKNDYIISQNERGGEGGEGRGI